MCLAYHQLRALGTYTYYINIRTRQQIILQCRCDVTTLYEHIRIIYMYIIKQASLYLRVRLHTILYIRNAMTVISYCVAITVHIVTNTTWTLIQSIFFHIVNWFLLKFLREPPPEFFPPSTRRSSYPDIAPFCFESQI